MSDLESGRNVELAAIAARSSSERFSRGVIGATTANETCMVTLTVSPSGGGSPAGLGVHEVDRSIDILAETMMFEIDGVAGAAQPGSVALFPKASWARQWRQGPGETIHPSINTPTQSPQRPFARSV